jgi:hypothetical protein
LIGEGERNKKCGTFKQCQSLAARLGLATGQNTVVVSVRRGRESDVGSGVFPAKQKECRKALLHVRNN